MKKFIELIKSQAVLIILLALIILLSIFAPNFATYRNFINLGKQIVTTGMISIGLTFVILGGSVDISVGSLFSLCGVIVISLLPYGLITAILITFIISSLLGFINAYIINKFRVESIIVTLGMLYVVAGLAQIWTDGKLQRAGSESSFARLTDGTLLSIPIYVFLFVILAIVLSVIMQKTSLGRNIYLIGTNIEAAKAAGIKINQIRIISFIVSSIFVAISAIILGSRMTSFSPLEGKGFEFNAIAAILIGGNSLWGGKGSIYNTVIGVILLSVLFNGMIIFGIDFAFQSILKGTLVMVAVWIDMKSRGKLL